MAHSEIIEVIKTTSSIGAGVEGDPCRELVEYFTKDGSLLFRDDQWMRLQCDETLKDAAQAVAKDWRVNVPVVPGAL